MESNVIVRGLTAIYKELQSIHGEMTLIRNATEGCYEVQKRTSDKIAKIENHLFISNQMASEIVGSTKKTADSALIIQCELNRLLRGKENDSSRSV